MIDKNLIYMFYNFIAFNCSINYIIIEANELFFDYTNGCEIFLNSILAEIPRKRVCRIYGC